MEHEAPAGNRGGVRAPRQAGEPAARFGVSLRSTASRTSSSASSQQNVIMRPRVAARAAPAVAAVVADERLSTVDVPSALLRDMEAKITTRLLQPARSIGRHDVGIVAVTPIPQQPIVQKTPGGTWFFASDYREDPGLVRDGSIAIPQDQLDELWRLHCAGVHPDLLWIAHEIPAGWAPGRPLPDLVPSAPRVQTLDAELERFVRLTVRASAEVARGIAIVTGVTVGLAVGAAVAPLALAGLDPVVLAGFRHQTEPIAAWAPLAAWEWK